MKKNYQNLMKYGPPTDRQRHAEDAYAPGELDDMIWRDEQPRVSFPTPDGYSLKNATKYGPPSDQQRRNANIYMPGELDDMIWRDDSDGVRFPTASGYAMKEAMKYGPPNPSALEKFILKLKGE
jgi:hypothetical protein